jgi:hypothetical protein
MLRGIKVVYWFQLIALLFAEITLISCMLILNSHLHQVA